MFGEGSGDIEIIMDDKNIDMSPEAMIKENITCSSSSESSMNASSARRSSEMNAKISENSQ
jgi:hypothetical protein